MRYRYTILKTLNTLKTFKSRVYRLIFATLILLILPQLVSLLQFENAQDGCLTVFLLDQSWRSMRFAFYLHMALVTAYAYLPNDIFVVVRELLEWSGGKALKEKLILTRQVGV